ncbi:MAG TPA: GNAT family N-acetyltransferase [Plantibacter sp.]|uniref:GNAT family N-acetyltransferase n=1 Tax=unclassified Plantibacter TaxID=2624265 RepID=UPI002B641DC6|nr:GNAT family N-acetyltransferase [Plantibacter sp.]
MNARLVPMPTDRLRGWMLAANAQYRIERIEAGETEAEATAKAAQSLADTFPAGRMQVGHLVFEVMVDEVPVGVLWIGPRSTSQPDEWWIWDVEIDEAHRGRGFGRRAMELAETAAQEQGAKTLGLNVFGFNRVARGLYESLGYETMAVQMRKAL